MTLGERGGRKQRKWRQFAGRYRWRWGREGKLDAWSRWGIKQWGSCDMMGFPYIPPFECETYTEAGSDSNTLKHSLLIMCRNESRGTHKFCVCAQRDDCSGTSLNQ